MLAFLKLIWNAIKRLFGFLGDHGDVIAKGAAVAGGAAAAVGAGAGIRANRVNKKALAMREEALSAYQDSNAQTEAVMEKLGDLQIEIIGTFDSFVETMEKIKQRPEGLKSKLAKVTLPDFKPEDLKTLSNNLQMALAGAGGAVAGIGIGVAAFGINTLALGPGALVGGAVLCVKGVSLSKKATKNKREAVQLKKDVEKICAYHAQLRGSAGMLYQSMLEIRQQYLSHLSALKTLVSQKTDCKEYTKAERLLVLNSILLVSLMYDMCKVTLVQKAENENSVETVNEKEVKRIVESANRRCRKIQPVPEALAI